VKVKCVCTSITGKRGVGTCVSFTCSIERGRKSWSRSGASPRGTTRGFGSGVRRRRRGHRSEPESREPAAPVDRHVFAPEFLA
jgi:hypothetical protein